MPLDEFKRLLDVCNKSMGVLVDNVYCLFYFFSYLFTFAFKSSLLIILEEWGGALPL